MRVPTVFIAFVPVLVLVASASVRAGGLKLLDKPLLIFPGQPFRIAIEQPKGSGTLDVAVPPTLEMFDTWPKDSIQRFYFRSLKAGDATLAFKGKAGTLTVPLEVIPWSDLFKPRKFRKITLPRVWPMGEADYAHLKRRRTFHGDDELKALRASGGKPHATAREWLKMSDDEVWNIIPGPAVPRTCLIVLGGGGREDGRGKGCPVCGMKVYEGRSGFYPWRFDPKNHPWKVGCPNCGTWFPSNDWNKGDMHSGAFPDDGFGCEPVKPVIAPNGVPWRWPFVAYYHQWIAYMRTLTPGIQHTADAFARTGDRRYAHKCAVALFRYAESMLDMAANMAHRKMAVRDAILRGPVGAPKPRPTPAATFLYIQPNWDTPRMEQCARAWDLVFDQLDGDEALLELCRTHHHPEIKTIEDFRRFVEAGVVRVPLQACLDHAVARNYPMEEVTVATMAVVMDSPRALDLADWLLNDGAAIRFALSNMYFKDGSAYESESYNGIHIRDMDRMFDLLDRVRRLYPDEWKKRGLPSLYDDPKYRLLFDFPLDDSLIGRTYPGTGDCGSPTTAPQPPRQGYPVGQAGFVRVYEKTRDPRFAQAMARPDGSLAAAPDDPALRAEAEKAVKERGWQVKLGSNILDGYGHAILRSGEGDHQRAFWLRYGRIKHHAHQDILTMGLAALTRDMLPELGYPQGWTYHGQWAANWGTHYGTHITGLRTAAFGRGALSLFADTAPARVASATSRWLSGKKDASRARLIALIDLSERDCYALTLERVRGGAEHRMSFHCPDGDTTTTGLQLIPQKGGTMLGPDAEYGDWTSVRRVDTELSCLAFMYDVQHAQPKGIWALDTPLRNQKGVHLRSTMIVPGGGELALAKGRPPQGNKKYEMTWAILRREGAEPLGSQFLTVLEPYEGERHVTKIEQVKLAGEAKAGFEPLAVRVTSKEFVDTIIVQGEAPVALRTPDGIVCDGEFGLWRERDGKLVAATLAGGTRLRKGDVGVSLPSAAYRGRVKSCDWAKRSIIVEPAPDNPTALVGQHVQIHNQAGSHAAFLIQAAQPVEGGCKLTLPFDPRIGEGFVKGTQDGAVVSATSLRFWNYWRYYAGKSLANEDGSTAYRLRDVDRKMACVLDEAAHGKLPVAKLRAEFADSDGDGRPRFVIYDYGPGDEVTIKHCATVSR